MFSKYAKSNPPWNTAHFISLFNTNPVTVIIYANFGTHIPLAFNSLKFIPALYNNPCAEGDILS